MKQIRNVTVSELKSGMVLARDVIDPQGRIVYPQGKIMTEANIDRLRELVVNYIPVVSADGLEAPQPQSFKDLGVESRPDLNHVFRFASMQQPLMQKLYQECVKRIPFYAEEKAPVPQKMSKYLQPWDMVKGMNKVSILPSNYLRLTELAHDPESSSQDLAKVINDSGLATIILKTVNSAHYGLFKKVDSISRAITLIGTRQLCELVLAFTVLKTFENIPQEIVNFETFSQHGIACGIFARELAVETGQTNTERYFTAGLIHDIGRLVLYDKAPQEMKLAIKMSRDNEKLLYLCENQIFGFNHSDVGAALLKYWGLPPILQEIVLYHHNPHASPNKLIDTTIVHVADVLANALQHGTSGECLVPPIQAEAMAKLNFNPASLPRLIDRANEQIEVILQYALLK